jgi:RNA polymerase sigma-70 factor, ECF subfamily
LFVRLKRNSNEPPVDGTCRSPVVPSPIAAASTVPSTQHGLVRPERPRTPVTLARQASSEAADRAMERFLGGDAGAFPELYRNLAPALTRSLQGRADHATVEDVVQETFLRIYRARSTFRGGAAVTPWALTIANRLLIDLVRARKREGAQRGALARSARAADDDATQVLSPHSILWARRLEVAAREAIDELSPRLAEAFLLVRGEGLCSADAARRTGMTEAALRLRVFRAVASIRRSMARELDM